MRMKSLFLWLVVLLVGCARHVGTRQVPLENDRSIAFPQFFADAAVMVGAGEKLYELDGVVLRAVSIAANDFLPPGDEEQPCWMRQEAYRYRVIRQGDIIFVRIMEDPEHCGMQYVSVDTGAKYAISSDGRILRRIIGAEPEAPLGPKVPDAGHPESLDEQQDGGVEPLGPSAPAAYPPIEGGGSSVADGGSGGVQ
jgi:hypothetical protein